MDVIKSGWSFHSVMLIVAKHLVGNGKILWRQATRPLPQTLRFAQVDTNDF